MEEILSSIKKIIAEDGDKSLSTSRPRRALSREPSHDEFGSVRLAQPISAPAVDSFVDDDVDIGWTKGTGERAFIENCRFSMDYSGQSDSLILDANDRKEIRSNNNEKPSKAIKRIAQR